MSYKITPQVLRDAAFACLQAQKERNIATLVVGIDPEQLFSIANALEDAGVQDDDPADYQQMEFPFSEDFN